MGGAATPSSLHTPVVLKEFILSSEIEAPLVSSSFPPLSTVALEEHMEKYEKQLALLKEQFAEDRLTGPPSPVPKATLTSLPSEKEERKWENQEMLLQSFVRANRLVQEANMLSEELRRDTFFKVTLQIPPKYLRPKAMVSLCVGWSGVECGVEWSGVWCGVVWSVVWCVVWCGVWYGVWCGVECGVECGVVCQSVVE